MICCTCGKDYKPGNQYLCSDCYVKFYGYAKVLENTFGKLREEKVKQK